jgi:hypothetical protein
MGRVLGTVGMSDVVRLIAFLDSLVFVNTHLVVDRTVIRQGMGTIDREDPRY